MNVPESCVGHREVAGEALTGVSIGQPLSRERKRVPRADAVHWAEGNTHGCAIASVRELGVVGDPGMSIRTSHGNREISSLATCGVLHGVRIGKARSRSR
jgi:hypothetical protein